MLSAAKYATEALLNRVVSRLKERGFKEDSLDNIKRDLMENIDLLGKVAAEEEHGIREEVIEEPFKAGLYTGLFYILGSIFPLLPYFLLLPINIAVPLSFTLAALLLSITGFIIAVSGGINIKHKVIEMVVAGLGAAVITYLIGYAASTILGIEVE